MLNIALLCRRCLHITGFMVGCLATSNAIAIQITFTKIADTSTIAPEGSAFSSFDAPPAMSGNNVVFAADATTTSGVYTATTSGAGITKIADLSDAVPGHAPFAFMGGFPIISGNNVAFFGSYSLSTPAGAICTGTVGQSGFTKLVDTSDSVLTNGNPFFTPQINFQSISGNNVVVSVITTNSYGVYNGTAGVPGVSKFVGKGNVSADNVTFIDAGGAGVSGNNVVFSSNFSGGSGVFTGSLGSTVFNKIVTTADAAPGHTAFTRFDTTSISGNNVAVIGEYSGGSGIYAGTVGVAGVTKIVDTSNSQFSFSSFTNVIASGNEIAFTDNVNSGIFVESGGVLYPVISTGNSLFGGFVSSITLGGFDDSTNTVSFFYRSGGTSGVAVATLALPEPSTFGVLALATAMGMRRRRK